MMRFGWRSLRYHALLVVVAIVVLPLVWVWSSGPLEQGIVLGLRRTLYDALSEAVHHPDEPDELTAIARHHRIRLRVVTPDGGVPHDADHTDRPSVLRAVEDPFYGPGGAPNVTDVDASLAPLRERAEMNAATASPAARCEVIEDGFLLLCAAAQRLPDGRRIHVMRGSPRLVRSLYDERFQLTAITLAVLGVGVLVAGWLSWRIVGPIEQLREAMLARIRGPVSTEPVELQRDDEFGDLANAFNALLVALDARNRANLAFAADLAHELKNPVAAVRAAAETLADRPVDDVRRARLGRILATSTARLEQVLTDFLELAQAEAGLPDRPRELVDVHALCAALLDECRTDPRYSDRTFVLKGPFPTVTGVIERIETAVRNVVANAAHFAGEGGRITVTVTAGSDAASITVHDTGPGIPELDRTRIFERYVTTREGGTGLGLPMTRAIVEAHGGRADVRDTPDGGTTIELTLPY